MKTTFIATVYNEESDIKKFLDSIFNQTKKPDEIIITDGGSTDLTQKIIKEYFSKHKSIPGLLIIKKGNRSVGRNAAIGKAKGQLILCSDAGNILDKDWVKNILGPFKNKKVDVVAGYYDIKETSPFAKAVASYVFVMPDKINPKTFLPATRSMAFRKEVWKKAGKFPEKYSHNEDYVFANRLKKMKANISFLKNAVAYWLPPRSFKKIFVMFYRFAKGDAEAKLFRPKVIILFLRYILALALLVILFVTHSLSVFTLLIVFLLLYILWAITKNYLYVQDWRALYLLPTLQFLSDIAVLFGTIMGIIQGWGIQKTR